MKKSLLAVAAMTAFAGAAQAQSSVTVYGIVDMGYLGTTAQTTNKTTGVQTKTTTSQFTSGNEATSRLGFKGVEDLGGGASALFTVEMGLNVADAALTGTSGIRTGYEASSQKGGSTVDNRQSFVGLKKNGIGQFTLGRQYTLNYDLQASNSPTNNAVMPGNVMYPNRGGGQTGVDSDAAMTLRASNALILKSDRFAGFSGQAMYALANRNTTDTGALNTGTQNWNGYGLRADYIWNKLFVGVSYQSFKTQYANGISSSAAFINAGLTPNQISTAVAGTTAIVPAVQLSDKQTDVVATYDFGILKAYAGWVGRKIQNDYTTDVNQAGAQVNRNAQMIGVRSFLTPTIEAYGTVGNGRSKATIASTYNNFTGWQVGSNYYLSKRTNLYAIYGSQTSTSNNINGSASNAAYAVGVVHTF